MVMVRLADGAIGELIELVDNYATIRCSSAEDNSDVFDSGILEEILDD